jgi:protein-L-isoaspartate(D-aspartate) O-methyltransferase
MAELIADPFRAARLILQLRRQGIRDNAVLSAMETLNRAAFVDAAYGALAEGDTSIPIACGQTMPRPVVIAQLLAALKATAGREDRILLIGAGSGYLAALLAQIGRHVWAIERYARLTDETRKRLARLKVENVTLKQGDGLAGWRDHAPFDRIILSGAVDQIPANLLEELGRGGALVAPVGKPDGHQIIQRVGKTGETATYPIEEPLPLLRSGIAAAL